MQEQSRAQKRKTRQNDGAATRRLEFEAVLHLDPDAATDFPDLDFPLPILPFGHPLFLRNCSLRGHLNRSYR